MLLNSQKKLCKLKSIRSISKVRNNIYNALDVKQNKKYEKKIATIIPCKQLYHFSSLSLPYVNIKLKYLIQLGEVVLDLYVLCFSLPCRSDLMFRCNITRVNSWVICLAGKLKTVNSIIFLGFYYKKKFWNFLSRNTVHFLSRKSENLFVNFYILALLTSGVELTLCIKINFHFRARVS